MIAVSDSSVLISLSSISHLNLLHHRFPNGILVPPAVWHEVVNQGGNRAGAREIQTVSWLAVEAPVSMQMVQVIQSKLGAGEAEAIVLALEKQSPLLLDERDARKYAKTLKLPVLGTVGILIWARQNGLITSLKDVLNTLQNEGKFRLAANVYRQALLTVGER